MVITPNSTIKLLKCPLTLDNKNQLTFANSNDQFNYFNSLESVELDNATYQRKDGVLRYPGHFDNLIKYNYCMYQNTNYSNKWFYAFISGMRYVNDNMTEITLKTDVFQTWQFDLQFKESFIDREMIDVSQDVPGANLMPENLETGEYKVGGTAEFDNLEPVWCVAYLGTQVLGYVLGQGGYIANGMAQSVTFLICTTLESYNTLMGALNQDENASDYIMSCFSIPRLAVQNFLISDFEIDAIPNCYALIQGNDFNQTPVRKTLVSTPNSLDGYVPRNQKLRTYPFMYVGFNPANGSSKIYRYEDFANGTPEFDLICEVNPNPTIVFVPQNYRGQSGNSMSDISTLNGYPTLSSRSDYFNSWLAQNSNIISVQNDQQAFNTNMNNVQTGLNAAGSMINNGLKGDVGSAISDVANAGVSIYQNSQNFDYYIKGQMAQIEKQQMLPDKANLSSSNATLIGYGMQDKNIFTRYTCKKEFAERIDKYFDMYGYFTNTVKVPNLNNRPNWNYVKTVGANILGDIPETDLLEIRGLFDNGITLWHNQNTFLDYSRNNR